MSDSHERLLNAVNLNIISVGNIIYGLLKANGYTMFVCVYQNLKSKFNKRGYETHLLGMKT